MCQFFDKHGYPVSIIQAGHYCAQQIDWRSVQQTAEKENTDCIPFTLTFHPHNHMVKSLILKNFKLLKNDSVLVFISNQWPIWNFQMRLLTMQNLSFHS